MRHEGEAEAGSGAGSFQPGAICQGLPLDAASFEESRAQRPGSLRPPVPLSDALDPLAALLPGVEAFASAVAGAALHVLGGSVEVHGTRFASLEAQETGGAIAIFGGVLTLFDCGFLASRARHGGAAYAAGGTLVAVRPFFEANAAGEPGGRSRESAWARDPQEAFS